MKWLFIIPIALAIFIVGVSFYLQPNDFIGCQEKPLAGSGCEKADAIIAVSGGDTFARTDEAIKLYKNDWADVLIFSGAAKDKTGLSNAAAMKLHALQMGVPEEVILIDEFAETTEQNAENSQSLFERYDLDTIILVTSGYHQRRASLEFEKRADGITILNHPLLFDRDWSVWWWLTPRGWWLTGGEVAKIIVFYAQGVMR